MYYFGCLHLSMPLLVACKVASAGCFATDTRHAVPAFCKLPFTKGTAFRIQEIIGVLHLCAFKMRKGYLLLHS